MTADMVFREKRFAIYDQVEYTLAAGDQCEAFDDVLVVGDNFVRHPGGTWPIVSGDAVFQRYDVFLHSMTPI